MGCQLSTVHTCTRTYLGRPSGNMVTKQKLEKNLHKQKEGVCSPQRELCHCTCTPQTGMKLAPQANHSCLTLYVSLPESELSTGSDVIHQG